MPTCFPPLLIPNKGWPRDVGLGDRAGEASRQAFSVIERWAAALPCVEEGGLPKAWCGRDVATLAPGDSLNVDVTIDTDATQVLVTATCVIENTSGAPNTVNLTGWFRSGGATLNDHDAAADRGFEWPTGADRTLTATCLIDAGASAGFRVLLSGGSTGDVDVAISVDVLEVDGQSTSCCYPGG